MRTAVGALRLWPRRRWIVVALGVPVVAGVLAVTGVGRAWWAWPSVLVTAVLAALVLASYAPVPGSGRLLEVGCSPCAVVAGVAVVFALAARAGAAGSPAMAVIVAVLLLAALVQRLADATTCVAPSRPAARG